MNPLTAQRDSKMKRSCKSVLTLALLTAFCGFQAKAVPVPVSKTVDTVVFAHFMPWFESKSFSGSWGSHWTMNTQNPESLGEDGVRQIASHYHPLTGPYASADPDIIR